MTIASKLQKIAENEQKVYEAGKTKEWNDFWDAYQDGGTRTSYMYAFSHPNWNDVTFKPKYDIKPTGKANSMFYNARITNLKTLLDEIGVQLDTSGVTDAGSMFYITHTDCIPTIDLTGCDNIVNTFANTYCPTIEKIILRDDGTQTYNQPFLNYSDLKNIVIEGVIGKGFSMAQCSKLTVDSMKSVIAALKNYVGTEYESTYKLTLHDNAWNRLEASGSAPNGSTWKEYVQTVLGWNV